MIRMNFTGKLKDGRTGVLVCMGVNVGRQRKEFFCKTIREVFSNSDSSANTGSSGDGGDLCAKVPGHEK